MCVHPAGGLVSGTLVNALLFHFGHPAITITADGDGDDGGGGGEDGGDRGGDGVGGGEEDDDDDDDDDSAGAVEGSLTAALLGVVVSSIRPGRGPEAQKGGLASTSAVAAASTTATGEGKTRPLEALPLPRCTSLPPPPLPRARAGAGSGPGGADGAGGGGSGSASGGAGAGRADGRSGALADRRTAEAWRAAEVRQGIVRPGIVHRCEAARKLGLQPQHGRTFAKETHGFSGIVLQQALSRA